MCHFLRGVLHASLGSLCPSFQKFITAHQAHIPCQTPGQTREMKCRRPLLRARDPPGGPADTRGSEEGLL